MNKSTRIFYTLSSLVFALSSPLTASHAAIRTPASGDLFISEIMANPAAVADSAGEWFELFNPTADSLIISGLVISDNGSNRHQINTDVSFVLDSGQYLVLARNSDININGGVEADYVYSSFTLGNSSDAIIISSDDVEITRLEYSSGFVQSGKSTELFQLSETIESYQITQDSFIYGNGDIGTPGAVGSATLPVSSVPLPAAVWLFSSGLLGLFGISRKKNKNHG
ncbi:hypothetical protein MNBD_GAMMA25-1100 [hydrothermal vent metagenome]|uniref:LTD domain-containing protein n=1 Tax=hydrothermal vent metagenome TaxID=652676 RepID=A0A3B1APP5_9ZZZZ